MAGFPLMAFGAGLGEFAKNYAQQQEARALNQMRMLTLLKYQQELQDKQLERQSAEGLWGAIGGGGIRPVSPTFGGGSGGFPGGAPMPSATQASLAPGFSREPSGGLTRGGQPPDVTIGGMPAWQEGSIAPPGSGNDWLSRNLPVGARQNGPVPAAAALPWRTAEAAPEAYADISGPGAPIGGGAPAPSNIPPPRSGMNAPPAAVEQQVADASGAVPAQAPTTAPSGPIAIPDLRKRLNAIIPPDLNGRMSEAALKAKIDQACPTCPAVYKLKYLDAELKRLAPAEAERVRLAHERYKTEIDAETKMWEAETRQSEKREEHTIRRQERKEDRADQNWDLLTDPTNNQQYYVRKGHPETAIGLDGQPYKPGGAQRLGGGIETASGSRQKDINAETARLDNEFAASHPEATPADKAKAHTENALTAQKKWTDATTSNKRSSPTNMVMRKLMDENPDWGSEDILRAANRITAQQAIERRYGGGQGANQMAALNTVADHLKLMQQYARELRTGDTPFTEIPRLNQIIQFAAKERGLPEVTNFNVARDIMADEVVRLLTSTGGTEADRQGMQSRLAPMMSEYQQSGSLTAFERFVAGRFKGLEQGYARNDPVRTKDFRENLLTPEARELFVKHGEGAMSGAGPTQAAPVGPQEGQTATNPQTGAKLIYRGGRWVPLQ